MCKDTCRINISIRVASFIGKYAHIYRYFCVDTLPSASYIRSFARACVTVYCCCLTCSTLTVMLSLPNSPQRCSGAANALCDQWDQRMVGARCTFIACTVQACNQFFMWLLWWLFSAALDKIHCSCIAFWVS